MKYLSLFSGIEAASLAWEPLGWEPLAFAEIEPFPSAVLSERWPDVPNLGDVTTVDWESWMADNGRPDVIVAGSPCQAFSVAGNRLSLEDARGNLSLFTAELVRLLRPRFFLWENVPGALSTKDNAFGCFLGELVGAGEPLSPTGKRWTNAGLVSGPEATACWRILDAQYFGVAQRRRRLFTLVCPRDGADPAAVLLERESLFGDPAPRREPRTRTPGSPASGARGGSLLADTGIVRGLKARFGTSGPDLDDAEAGHLVSGPSLCLSARQERLDPSVETLVPGPWWDGSDVAECLDSSKLVKQQTMPDKARFAAVVEPIAFSCKDSGQDTGEISPTLRAMPENPGVSFNGGGQVAVAFTFESRHYTRGQGGAPSDLAPTLKVHKTGGPGDAEPLVFTGDGETADPVAANEQRTYTNEGAHNFRMHNVVGASAVRRLTPRECERLQGMPDDHTRIPWRGKAAKDCPDGPRYRAIGNSMAVPVIRWLGERIDENPE